MCRDNTLESAVNYTHDDYTSKNHCSKQSNVKPR